jgi:AcrR family transcriptional regulator
MPSSQDARRVVEEIPPEPRTRPRNRRELILEAAADLFASKGYDGVSVSEIGEAVGTAGSALYRHFKDKDALLREIVIDTLKTILSVVDPVAGQEAPRDRLRSALTEMFSYTFAHPGRVRTFVRERHRLRGPRDSEPRSLELRLLATLVQRVQDVVPLPDEVVLVRLIGTIGVTSIFGSHPLLISRRQIAGFLADALITVLTAPPPAGSLTRPGATPGASWRPSHPRSELIIEAALPLFRQRGFAGVGVAEVGEVSGIAGPNLYRYFESKDDIFIDIYDRVGGRVVTRLEDAVASADDAKDALARMVSGYVKTAFESPDFIVVTSRGGADLPDAERPRLRRRRRWIHEMWRSVVAEVRPDLSAREVGTLVAAAFAFINVYPLAAGSPADLPPESVVAPMVLQLLARPGS